MRHAKRWLAIVGMLVALLQLSACAQPSAEAAGGVEPATVEHVEGSKDDRSRLTLTPRAVERLGIQTRPVLVGKVGNATRRVVPYGALLYDAKGDTWVYVNPAPLDYVREPVTVDHIEGDQAVLTDGPPEGTRVVSVGAAELYGTETGVGH
jgi:hypothetical protein